MVPQLESLSQVFKTLSWIAFHIKTIWFASMAIKNIKNETFLTKELLVWQVYIYLMFKILVLCS